MPRVIRFQASLAVPGTVVKHLVRHKNQTFQDKTDLSWRGNNRTVPCVITVEHRGFTRKTPRHKGTQGMDTLIKLHVEGVGQGLLMHNPAGMAAAASEGDKPQRAGKKIPKPEDEALASLYVLPESNQLYAAGDWFREASIIAAKEFRDTSRRGRATMQQRVTANLFLSELYFPLANMDTGKPITSDPDDWEMWLKRVVIQRQGIVRARGLIHNWACDVEFEYDNEAISPDEIAPIVNAAGKFPGVGDYRPGTKGPFGRFRVTELNGESWSRGN